MILVRTKNNDNLTKLQHKYQYVCIKDEFEGKVEIRRIINIEWQISKKRGESAGYVAVTQLIEEGMRVTKISLSTKLFRLHFMNAFMTVLALTTTGLILFSANILL